jgi:hypothetical protein
MKMAPPPCPLYADAWLALRQRAPGDADAAAMAARLIPLASLRAEHAGSSQSGMTGIGRSSPLTAENRMALPAAVLMVDLGRWESASSPKLRQAR